MKFCSMRRKVRDLETGNNFLVVKQLKEREFKNAVTCLNRYY